MEAPTRKSQGAGILRSEEPIASSTDDNRAPEIIDEKGRVDLTSTQAPVPEHEQEAWNSSRINIYRYVQVLLAFIVLGIHDGSIGALIPYVGSSFRLQNSILTLRSLRRTTIFHTPSSPACSSPRSPATLSPLSSSTGSTSTSGNSASL